MQPGPQEDEQEEAGAKGNIQEAERLRMSRRWMLEFRLLNLHILIELVEFPKGSMPCHGCISDQSKLAT
jgi:hypothetical protein